RAPPDASEPGAARRLHVILRNASVLRVRLPWCAQCCAQLVDHADRFRLELAAAHPRLLLLDRAAVELHVEAECVARAGRPHGDVAEAVTEVETQPLVGEAGPVGGVVLAGPVVARVRDLAAADCNRLLLRTLVEGDAVVEDRLLLRVAREPRILPVERE